MLIRLCCIFVLLACGPAVAADFSFTKKNIIMMEGDVVAGDFARLRAMTKGRLIDILKIRSPGGDVVEALKIADFLNDRLITAEIPLTLFISETPPNCSDEGLQDRSNCVCFSACSVIWMTAPMRMGDYVGIHRPRFDNKYFANLNSVDAQAKYADLLTGLASYLRTHDVPEAIITKMMSVSSGDNYMMQEREVKSVGTMRPYLDEMLLARCDHLSAGNAEFLRLDRALKEALMDQSRPFEEVEELFKAWTDHKDLLGFGKCRGDELKKIRAERQGG